MSTTVDDGADDDSDEVTARSMADDGTAIGATIELVAMAVIVVDDSSMSRAEELLNMVSRVDVDEAKVRSDAVLLETISGHTAPSALMKTSAVP